MSTTTLMHHHHDADDNSASTAAVISDEEEDAVHDNDDGDVEAAYTEDDDDEDASSSEESSGSGGGWADVRTFAAQRPGQVLVNALLLVYLMLGLVAAEIAHRHPPACPQACPGSSSSSSSSQDQLLQPEQWRVAERGCVVASICILVVFVLDSVWCLRRNAVVFTVDLLAVCAALGVVSVLGEQPSPAMWFLIAVCRTWRFVVLGEAWTRVHQHQQRQRRRRVSQDLVEYRALY